MVSLNRFVRGLGDLERTEGVIRRQVRRITFALLILQSLIRLAEQTLSEAGNENISADDLLNHGKRTRLSERLAANEIGKLLKVPGGFCTGPA